MVRRTNQPLRLIVVYALLGFVASIGVAWVLVPTMNLSTRPLDEHIDRENQSLFLGGALGGNITSSTRFVEAVHKKIISFGSIRRSVEFKSQSFWESRTNRNNLSLSLPPATAWTSTTTIDLHRFMEHGHFGRPFLPPFAFAFPSQGIWGNARSFDSELPQYPGSTRFLEDARGFPFLCLWNEWEELPDGSLLAKGGIALPDLVSPTLTLPPAVSVRALPYRPIWAGLAANTLFYAMLFWIGARLFLGSRGSRRFRRGLCTGCGYDLLYDYKSGCPECGWKPRTRAN